APACRGGSLKGRAAEQTRARGAGAGTGPSAGAKAAAWQGGRRSPEGCPPLFTRRAAARGPADAAAAGVARRGSGPGTLPPGAHAGALPRASRGRSEEHTSELQSRENLVCRLLLEKKKKINATTIIQIKIMSW